MFRDNIDKPLQMQGGIGGALGALAPSGHLRGAKKEKGERRERKKEEKKGGKQRRGQKREKVEK